MKLVDLLDKIDDIDEELIIFQEDKTDFNSDIILLEEDDDGGVIKVKKGKKYHYLIEVYLAKEFIEDWVASLDYAPTKTEIAKRLFEYAINDA